MTEDLRLAIDQGNLEAVKRFLPPHDLLDDVDDRGMSALHYAVGRDQLEIARYLVSMGARFFPDAEGRMPTTIAAICEVSEEMCDYISMAESVMLDESPALISDTNFFDAPIIEISERTGPLVKNDDATVEDEADPRPVSRDRAE